MVTRQPHTQIMKYTHKHKAVTGCIEAKKLLPLRRQSEYRLGVTSYHVSIYAGDLITDIVATKHHQWLDEILHYFLLALHPKIQQNYFQENSVMQHTRSTLNMIQFVQQILALLL